MKKIPTIFERDWNGDRSRVLDKPHPDCAWVFAGEGIATRKVDGTSCMVRGGRLFKRHAVRLGKARPVGFEAVDHDDETGTLVGWVPVGDGPEDRWHREAFEEGDWADGTYELVGPKVQGNPEGYTHHALVFHGDEPAGPIHGIPTSFAELRDCLAANDIEGIVWHHPDGRMAKIKKRDFGLPRKPAMEAAA